jgi:leucyl/phenylalanyl-tRNA--protein transferase
MPKPFPTLPWLEPGDPFPAVESAWGLQSEAPGLLAAGGDLSVGSLRSAYAQGVFPWFSEGQPNLWWSPDPRMVLQMDDFRLHRSLRKTLTRFIAATHCEVRFNTAFAEVISSCAQMSRRGQPGTWILPPMVEAYTRLHVAGHAHSVETWMGGQLVGGLYCVALGKAVFGESMFTHVPDASKIALAALVAFGRHHGVKVVDCQQKTAHLASLGAAEIPRSAFLTHIWEAQAAAPLEWRFAPIYWNHILSA